MRRIITFPKLGKYGRLGNQLWQIAGIVGLSKKHGMDYVIPTWKYARYFNPLVTGKAHGFVCKERHYHHHDWDYFPSRGNIAVEGYLQSYRYWEEYGCPLKLRSGFLRVVKQKNEKILGQNPIGIHIRRGDYVNNPNYTQLSMGYYISALEKHFPDWRGRRLVIFSDDLDYCRVHFGCLDNVTYTDRMSDIESLALMSLMTGLVIANSSFSWWGAYFASQNGAKIVRPSRYMEGKLGRENDIRDLYPPAWEVHDSSSKVDLTDVTFTIPVSYDHPDRQQNLDLCIRSLEKDFNTGFIVMEQYSRRQMFQKIAGYRAVLYREFKDGVFHRTKMLNMMARDANTKFVANWDADMVCPPMQLWLTLDFLRGGGEMCFPYDGVFARIPRKAWYRKILDEDIGVVKRSVFPGMTEGFVSVGGAVLFNRAAFLNNGGENERFISYGSEDVERVERFRRLGLRFHRVPGPIYHIDHFVGVNSCKDNPYFASNEKELERIRKLSDRQLKIEFASGK